MDLLQQHAVTRICLYRAAFGRDAQSYCAMKTWEWCTRILLGPQRFSRRAGPSRAGLACCFWFLPSFLSRRRVKDLTIIFAVGAIVGLPVVCTSSRCAMGDPPFPDGILRQTKRSAMGISALGTAAFLVFIPPMLVRSAVPSGLPMLALLCPKANLQDPRIRLLAALLRWAFYFLLAFLTSCLV